MGLVGGALGCMGDGEGVVEGWIPSVTGVRGWCFLAYELGGFPCVAGAGALWLVAPARR